MHKWKQTNQIHQYLQCNNATINSTSNIWNNLSIQVQYEEPLLLGLGVNLRASTLWVNLVLDQGNASHFH